MPFLGDEEEKEVAMHVDLKAEVQWQCFPIWDGWGRVFRSTSEELNKLHRSNLNEQLSGLGINKNILPTPLSLML
jgi:hypothetical protein